MSVGKIIIKQAFGINNTVKNGLIFSNDHQLLYVTGNNVVVYNLETREQSFIQSNNSHVNSNSYTATSGHSYIPRGITAISTSPHKKIIAVAERVDPTAVLTFYDSGTLRRKKFIQYGELGSKEIVSISFSDDGKYCIAQGGAPDWNLVQWNVEKVICVLI